MDTLAHQLVLLELCNDSGTSLIRDGVMRTVAVAGALAAELQLRDRLVPVAADRFALASGRSELPVLAEAERLLPSRPRPLKRIISRLSSRGGRLRSMVIDDLVQAGALRLEQDKLWIIPYRNRWPTAEPRLEETLVEHLRAWVGQVQPADPPDRPDLLLGLARSAKLLDAVWSEAELQRVKPLIDERTDRAPLGRTVRDVVQEHHAAMAAAAVVT